VSLALRTGIPVREWERESNATVLTALDMLGMKGGGDD
jgi:hypothetical protein